MCQKYSTTQYLTKQEPDIVNSPKAKYQSLLLLPPKESKNGEGGFRTNGYFKQSLPDKPLVTIITVVYNGVEYLEGTIRSVIEQTYDNIEYIIVDGGSDDGSVDLIKKYEDRIDYWVSENDNGIYPAMNKGITLANGDIIGIINSDDWLELETVKMVVGAASTIEEDQFVVHGKVAFYSSSDILVGVHGPKNIPGYYLFSTPFKHPSMFVSKELYSRVGLFDASNGLAADYDLMLRIVAYGCRTEFINRLFTNVRLVGVSTGGYSRVTNKELLMILKRNTGSWLLASLGLVVRTINRGLRTLVNG